MGDRDRCYAAAIRILNYRWNSTAELRRKLRAKGFDSETIESTLGRLAAEKWLDDQRFAGAYVRGRHKKRGRVRLRHELIRAGIASEVINQAVDENVDREVERAQAAALAEKRLPTLIRRYGPAVARNKLTAYLLNQGYDAALVRAVIKETKVAQD
jgi:regulatory protein